MNALDALMSKANALFNSNFMMPLNRTKLNLISVGCWLWMGCTSVKRGGVCDRSEGTSVLYLKAFLFLSAV